MGGTAPRSLCLGGELLIPLRGAALRSPTVNQKSTRRKHTLPQLIPWQGHDRLARNSSPPLTATDYWWSGLHWTATMDHSHSATDILVRLRWDNRRFDAAALPRMENRSRRTEL